MDQIILKEFDCGHSIRTGTQFISWFVIVICVLGLYGINFYYYDTKKVKLTEFPLTLLILNFTVGIISVCGLFGAYYNRRIWLKVFLIFLVSQIFFIAILFWVYYFYIYPGQPSYPKKTRYAILNPILLGAVFLGIVSYAAALNVYSYYKQISSGITDREFLISNEDHQVLLNEDNFPSKMSLVSAVTRSYLTTMQVNKQQRYLTQFNPPAPVPEETPNYFYRIDFG